jgi:Flp pilus assembly protein TadG
VEPADRPTLATTAATGGVAVTTRRRSRDRGATAVEAALTIPLLLLIVFGIIDFGRMLNVQLSVSAAAREGARAEAVGGSATDRVADIMGPIGYDLDVDDACSGNPRPDDDARVTVSSDFSFVTPLTALAGITGDGTLSATGVMPCRG